MQKIIVKSEAEVINRLAKEIEQCAKQALSNADVFRIGLSGGSMVNYLGEAIQRIDSDLSKWKFYFCDERYVPSDDGDSTFGCYKRKLLPKSSKLKELQFEQINTKLPLGECAREYEARIRKDFNLEKKADMPVFDLLLLGMGPDGHTCSLFPGHALLKEENLIIASIADSPKPPPQRVTMTLPVLNNAKCCMFAMSGVSKSEMIKRVFVEKADLPAAMVSPHSGKLICIFDEAAAIMI